MARDRPSPCLCSCPTHRPSSLWGGPWGTVPGSSGRAAQGSVTLLLLLLLLSPLPTRALCEDRCERAVPLLGNFRALWSRSFKRVGEKRVSFEEFLVSLVQASITNGRRRTEGLTNALLNLVGQYQDCVLACEHPFSKRGTAGLADDDESPKTDHDAVSISKLCTTAIAGSDLSAFLAHFCLKYGGQQ